MFNYSAVGTKSFFKSSSIHHRWTSGNCVTHYWAIALRLLIESKLYAKITIQVPRYSCLRFCIFVGISLLVSHEQRISMQLIFNIFTRKYFMSSLVLINVIYFNVEIHWKEYDYLYTLYICTFLSFPGISYSLMLKYLMLNSA
jgi:hypothetical protein